MTDPRIKRTREHVLRTARRMLAERNGATLTLSALAAEAQVSRRTLYVHWGTIQQVIGDAVTFLHAEHSVDPAGKLPREILGIVLAEVRSDIHDPASNVALATMLSSAAQSAPAADVVRTTAAAGYDEFVELLGPITTEQYAQLVGPIFYAEFVLREPASDALIQTLVELGLEILGLPELTALPTLTA